MGKRNGSVLDREVSFVVQGPIVDLVNNKRNCTKKLLESIRKCFPSSQIILSTWEGENVVGLDYDKVVFSKEPETVEIYYSGKMHLYTVNHQIVSTLNGIRQAERKYVAKIRSDLLFINDNALKYLDLYKSYSEKNKKWRLFSERILTLPTYNHRKGMCFPYSIADWVYIGKKKDLLDLFDIPLMDMESLKIRESYRYPFLEDNIGAEQYYCVSCIKKHIPEFAFWGWECKEPNILEESEIFIAQNFVMLDSYRLGVLSQKIGRAAYAANPIFSSGLYTFNEWKGLYNRYGGGQLKHTFNPIEDLLYKGVFSIRNMIKHSNSGTYERIVGIIRKMRGAG